MYVKILEEDIKVTGPGQIYRARRAVALYIMVVHLFKHLLIYKQIWLAFSRVLLLFYMLLLFIREHCANVVI